MNKRETETLLPLFVYGSLKRGETNYIPYLAGRTVRERSASLPGAALYIEERFPFLVVGGDLADPTDRVHGTLMVLDPDSYVEVLRHVDWLEDYVPGSPDNLYERVALSVQVGGKLIMAWGYVAGAQVIAALEGARADQFRKLAGGTWSEQ